MSQPPYSIRAIDEDDRAWMRDWMRERWGGLNMVMRQRERFPAEYPGFVALIDEKPVGLITYIFEEDRCEITSLDSLNEGVGIGTALLNAVRQAAAEAGCARVTLIATNDNLHALGFYQRRGFAIAGIAVNAIQSLRETLKPQIPLIGMNGIPIRDEIELELKVNV